MSQTTKDMLSGFNRRAFGTAAAGTVLAAGSARAQGAAPSGGDAASSDASRRRPSRIQTRDGTELYVKDWGEGRPVILIHGWPLNADSFDRTAMMLAAAGFRAINYDRRGLGRSDQPWRGYDWDTLADDLADVMKATGATQDATVIGYSMGGGEAARYMSRYDGKGVIKIGLYASIAPGMLESADNPHGNPASSYDDISAGIQKDIAAFFREDFLPPFYGVGGPHRASPDVIEAAVTTALTAGMKPLIDMAHAFTFGDFVGDMPSIKVPTLIVHGTADRPVPIDATARRAHAMIPGSQLIEYEGHPHGFYATNADQMVADTLAFVRR